MKKQPTATCPWCEYDSEWILLEPLILSYKGDISVTLYKCPTCNGLIEVPIQQEVDDDKATTSL